MQDATGSSGAVAARARRVLSRFCEADLTLATAESCTGGLVAALLTDIEGCSHAFERGFVVYSDAAKQDMLGVDPDLLRDPGAVSRPVAIAMATGALRGSRADVAVSVTGYAGPAGEDAQEGLVHFALARRGAATRHEERAFGPVGRDAIRARCLDTVLELLERSAHD